LRVERQPTLVITQEHHYYPFGMNMSGIERDGELKYQFNGMVEKEQAFGLELYETPFRSYDAQLGRFWQVEPLADIYCSISMYQFAYNNPVSFNDPTGLSSDDPNDTGPRPNPDENGTAPAGGGGAPPGGYGAGAKIGGGGYTWELGNNRVSPYSMGGTPGQGPAVITIVNFDNNKGVSAAKVSLEGIFRSLRMDVRVNVVNSAEGLTRNDLLGINAVYLFGDTSSDEQKKAMNDAVIDLHPTSKFDNLVLNAGRPEYATGWKFIKDKNTGQFTTKPNKDKPGNFAVISSNSYDSHYTSGKKMSRGDFFALVILHVMGHNAGLNDPGGQAHMISPMASGAKFANMLENNLSIKDIVFNKQPYTKIFRGFVKSYFSSDLWNGNPGNSHSLIYNLENQPIWKNNLFMPYLQIER
jgi:RHS repeat-associated protein